MNMWDFLISYVIVVIIEITSTFIVFCKKNCCLDKRTTQIQRNKSLYSDLRRYVSKQNLIYKTVKPKQSDEFNIFHVQIRLKNHILKL